jgi:hypothetical protein
VPSDISEEHIASIFRVEEISSARNKFNGLHGVISQNMILFIITAVKTQILRGFILFITAILFSVANTTMQTKMSLIFDFPRS